MKKMIKDYTKLRCVWMNQSYPFIVIIFGKCFSCLFSMKWIASLSCGASFDVFNAKYICYCKILTTMQVLKCYSLTYLKTFLIWATPLIFILFKSTYFIFYLISNLLMFELIKPKVFNHLIFSFNIERCFVWSEHDTKEVWKWIM